MYALLQLVWIIWLTLTKDMGLFQQAGNLTSKAGERLKILDYHWVGGVTTTEANLKVTLHPLVAETNNTFYLDLTLTQADTGKVIQTFPQVI